MIVTRMDVECCLHEMTEKYLTNHQIYSNFTGLTYFLIITVDLWMVGRQLNNYTAQWCHVNKHPITGAERKCTCHVGN